MPLKGLMWIGGKVKEMVEREMTDEPKIHEELLELQMRLEMDEITEEEYEKSEGKLMEKLEEIRRYKEKEGG
ncbi:MAG: gas vesicle protein GvpG [Nitrospinae bacterium RIFCSPLOWO2_12_FULL_45_22]|nr:MAG: gas vesicle protein GvpG [Nitrospinae bacterium RIFCSPLOWO2_12_FULL_45_22]